MNFLSFAFFSVLVMAYETATQELHDSWIYSTGPHKIMKREDIDLIKQQEHFNNFVEEKLVQHSQALEQLVKLANEAVNAIKNLADNVGHNVQEPKLPEKLEMAKHKHTELNTEQRSGATESRRSYSWNNVKIPDVSISKTSPSAWCSVAVLCHRTGAPVCGYDDNYGYGKFDDLCHLVQVNCYFDYNFSLVPNCSSSS